LDNIRLSVKYIKKPESLTEGTEKVHLRNKYINKRSRRLRFSAPF